MTEHDTQVLTLDACFTNPLEPGISEMGRAGIEPATLGLKVTSGGCGRVRRSRENALNQRVSR